MKDIGRIWLDELNSTDVQIWVSDLSKSLSPKYVRNLYGLLSASVEMFAPDLTLKVTMPEKKRPDLYCPSDDDIKKLLMHAAGTDLEIAILLAAFGPMRRGEICALESSDIKGNKVSVTKSMVMGPDQTYHIKQPKLMDHTEKLNTRNLLSKKWLGEKAGLSIGAPTPSPGHLKGL